MFFTGRAVFGRFWHGLRQASRRVRWVFPTDDGLDVETMSDDRKRDIGLLDGRAPRQTPLRR